MANITAGAVEALRAAVEGRVSQPGEAGYADAVNIWNGAIARRPAVVTSCMSSSDVAAALAFGAALLAMTVSVHLTLSVPVVVSL